MEFKKANHYGCILSLSLTSNMLLILTLNSLQICPGACYNELKILKLRFLKFVIAIVYIPNEICIPHYNIV